MKKRKPSSTKNRSRAGSKNKPKRSRRQSLNVRVNSKKSVSVRRKIFLVRFLKWGPK